tara:strand:- start:4065 stop:4190 length:126 start_codon:yes stop_codon:yes gene_type:complete
MTQEEKKHACCHDHADGEDHQHENGECCHDHTEEKDAEEQE